MTKSSSRRRLDAIVSRRRRYYVSVRYGKLTEHIVGTVGYDQPSEVEYRDKHGRVVGFWAYGHFHPDYPFQG